MNKNSNNVKISVDNLREYATSRGLRVVFRKTPTNAGDFCFFIYKITGGRYLVGYDGYWSANPSDNTSFEKCWAAAHEFISNYDRF